MENPALNNRLRLHWAIFLNVPPEWPERRVQRVLEPYFIPEQWFLYDRFIDWFEDDPYARTQRKLERLMFTIIQINNGGYKKGRSKLCWVAVFTLIALYLYDSGFIKTAHKTYNKVVYNSAVKPCTMLATIDNKQSEFLEKHNLLVLKKSVNKIWHQVASEILLR